MPRNYRSEYDNYQGKPEQIKNRAARNKARALLRKKKGAAALKGKDVDHKVPFAKGGDNGAGNLRVQSVRSNRSFPRTKGAKMK